MPLHTPVVVVVVAVVEVCVVVVVVVVHPSWKSGPFTVMLSFEPPLKKQGTALVLVHPRTRQTSHESSGWLKEPAEWNIQPMDVTADTGHESSGWLKDPA